MKELFGNSCYAYCLSKLFSKSDDVKTLTKYVLEGWWLNYIEDDGYVAKPLLFVMMLNGHQYRDIKKVSISSLTELPEGEYIVEYKKTPTAKESHFVIANKDGVIWDPSGNSITVQTGAPFTYRRFV